jgi:hypothetical protein
MEKRTFASYMPLGWRKINVEEFLHEHSFIELKQEEIDICVEIAREMKDFAQAYDAKNPEHQNYLEQFELFCKKKMMDSGLEISKRWLLVVLKNDYRHNLEIAINHSSLKDCAQYCVNKIRKKYAKIMDYIK